MTAFIGATGTRGRADGLHRIQDDLRRRLDALRLTLVMNIIAIRLVRKCREVYE